MFHCKTGLFQCDKTLCSKLYVLKNQSFFVIQNLILLHKWTGSYYILNIVYINKYIYLYNT